MINLSILISSSEVSGPGGLFDFNLTLPLIAIQFILLTIVLNIINMVESKIILYMCHSKYSKY